MSLFLIQSTKKEKVDIRRYSYSRNFSGVYFSKQLKTLNENEFF